MNVHCTTCGEPWEVHHLWHDAIYDVGLSAEAAQAWHALPRSEKLSAHHRAQFGAAGWQFGRTLTNVIRCPCCPKDAVPDPERTYFKAALEAIFGDDPEGLASTFEEYGL